MRSVLKKEMPLKPEVSFPQGSKSAIHIVSSGGDTTGDMSLASGPESEGDCRRPVFGMSCVTIQTGGDSWWLWGIYKVGQSQGNILQ